MHKNAIFKKNMKIDSRNKPKNKHYELKDGFELISKQVENGTYFFGNLSPDCNSDFRLVCAGRELCNSSYSLTRGSFRYYAIEYIAQGSWVLECNGKTYELSAGTLFAYTPQTSYKLSAKFKGKAIKYFADFGGKKASKILKESLIPIAKPIHIAQTLAVVSLLEQCATLSNFKPKSAEEIGTLILQTLLRIIKEESKLGDAPLKTSYQTFLRCKTFMQENYLNINSMAQVAEKTFVRAAYLSRLFKEYSEQSPFEYLTMLKMNHAADMLLRKSCSIKDAAMQVGYFDACHFSRIFKKIYSISPKFFKNKLLQKTAD